MFTQGMEVSVPLHGADLLRSRWASSLMRKRVRPVVSWRCGESLLPGGMGQVVPRFGMFVHVKAFSTLGEDEDVYVRGKRGQIQV